MRSSLFFFDVTATPDIYTLSLHDALPISRTLGEQGLHPYTLGLLRSFPPLTGPLERMQGIPGSPPRSEEHTFELQSHSDLVCRLLLEKKKQITHTALTTTTRS